MRATEIISTLCMEKTALNKARALYEAGELSMPSMRRLFQRDIESAPVNLVHARINAKANRLAGGVAPKKQMDLSRYQRYGRPDTLPKERQVLDSGRITRRAGRNNGAVLSVAKENGWLSDEALTNGKPWLWDRNTQEPGVRYRINYDDRTGFTPEWDKTFEVRGIDIGPAGINFNSGGTYANQYNDNIKSKFSPQQLKEFRALIARHELSGELHDIIRGHQGVIDHGLPVANLEQRTVPLRDFKISSHQTPNVTQGDYNMARKMSPAATLAEDRLRSNSYTKMTFKHSPENLLSEVKARNILSDRDIDSGYEKPFTRKEKDQAMRNIGKLSGGDERYSEAFLKTKPILNTEY